MRLLKINGVFADIDEQTAIGITFQTFDIKDIARPFVNVSNTFTIPKTAKNLSIFGNAQDVQSANTTIYELASCDYYIDNYHFIKGAKVKVISIDERINLFIYQKDTVWDSLKTFYWYDFSVELLAWLGATKGYPILGSESSDNYQDFINNYTSSTEGVYLPFYYGNLLNQEDNAGFDYEIGTKITLNTDTYLGGHFCLHVKTIFEFLEFKYDVDFLTSSAAIWSDEIVAKMIIPLRALMLMQNASGYYFSIAKTDWQIPQVQRDYLPFTQVTDKGGKSLSDFIIAFINHLNLIKDESYVNGIYTVEFTRFDDLETAEVVDFSGNLAKGVIFKPTIEGYAQTNYVKFSNIFPGGSEFTNSKALTISNNNISPISDLLTIDGYVPSIINDKLALNTEESFETFTFLVKSGVTESIETWFRDSVYGNIVSNFDLDVVALYDLDSEYNFLDSAITYPKVYTIKKWLTLNDVKDLKFNKQYYIRELNGSFFINKISGFNPEKSKEATTIELLKLSQRTPPPEVDRAYWADGVGNIYTDGAGNRFY